MKTLSALVTVLALAGCGVADQSTSGLTASNPVMRKLPAGRYVVTVQGPSDCMDREYNLTQKHTFKNSNPAGALTIALGTDDTVVDNLIRPAVCRSGAVETGTTVVEHSAPFTVRIKAGKLRIAAVSEILKTATLAANAELKAGNYLVHVTRPGTCRRSSFTPKKELEFIWAADAPVSHLNVKLLDGTEIIDNLIRPMVCEAPSETLVDTGVAYMQLAKTEGTRSFAFAGLENVKVVSIEKVTKSQPR